MKRLNSAVLLLSVLLLTQSNGIAGTAAHGDHTTRHGGQFFMAPDGVHHLEGVLAGGHELRIYIYDAHTRKVSAAPFLKGAKVVVQRVDAKGRETGPLVPLQVAIGSRGDTLSAHLPRGFHVPVYVTAWLSFPGHPTPELFNFTFAKTDGTP